MSLWRLYVILSKKSSVFCKVLLRGIPMDNILTWDEIVKTYPEQRVAVEVIEWRSKDHRSILRGIVRASENDGLTKRQIAAVAVGGNGKIISTSTRSQLEPIAGVCSL